MTTALTDLNILALDCQTTGANPNKGHLLEIGWVPWYPTRPFGLEKPDIPDLESYLIRLPSNTTIPRAVQRITGITHETSEAAIPADIAWQHLLKTIEKMTHGDISRLCPTIIHFARFEEPFLRELQRKNNPSNPFPLRIICTHEIATRLLPNLPRRGIRAIAGYFGHSMSEIKRSSDHVLATVLIWNKLIDLLNITCGITGLDQLTEWLTTTPPAVRTKRVYPMEHQIRRNLPDKPGVYRMLRANGDLLYIGKAKSLKLRVSSYFRQKAPHAEHTLEMLTQACELNYTQTGTALEAAVLESDEIKLHAPPYNIALRERQRQLIFCSKDFSAQSPDANEKFPLGPLPGGKILESILALGSWLSGNMDITSASQTEIISSLLALPSEYAPELNCMRDGLKIFQDNYRSRLEFQSFLRFLTALGAQLWRKKLEAEAISKSAPEPNSDSNEVDEDEKEDGGEFVWTPKAVAKTVENTILHFAYLIRRARWFCLLSESSLAWASAKRPDKYKTLIILQNGSIARCKEVKVAAKTPVPPGFARSFQARQKNIDLMTYDRLRVVTTELRRLISEGRKIELRLNSNVVLGHQQVMKALRWV
jgi:DNA polymerase-3 subunit epsilon